MVSYSRSFLALLALALIIAACSAAPTTAPPSTATAQPTTATPTPEPAATDTPLPTATSTPVPTQTPLPSPTPTEDPLLVLDTQISPTKVTHVAASDNGQILVVAQSGGNITVWDLFDGNPLHSWEETGEITQIVLSPEGRFLAVVVDETQINLYRTSDGGLIHTVEESSALEIRFSPDGEYAATFAPMYSNAAQLWRTGDGELLAQLASDEDYLVTTAEFSPDGGSIAVGFTGGVIRFYRASDGAFTRKIQAHTDWVLTMSFSPDGKLLATDSLSFDPYARVWQVSGGALLQTLDEESWEDTPMFFSPDGELLALVSSDAGGTKIWRVRDWAFLGTVPALGSRFSPDGKNLIEDRDNNTTLWPLTGEPFQEIQPISIQGVVLTAWADGTTIVYEQRETLVIRRMSP